MNRRNRTESAIFVSLMCSLLPEELQSELMYTKHFFISYLGLKLTDFIILLTFKATQVRLPGTMFSKGKVLSGSFLNLSVNLLMSAEVRKIST